MKTIDDISKQFLKKPWPKKMQKLIDEWTAYMNEVLATIHSIKPTQISQKDEAMTARAQEVVGQLILSQQVKQVAEGACALATTPWGLSASADMALQRAEEEAILASDDGRFISRS